MQDFVITEHFSQRIINHYGSDPIIQPGALSPRFDDREYLMMWNYLLQIRTVVLKQLEEFANF